MSCTVCGNNAFDLVLSTCDSRYLCCRSCGTTCADNHHLENMSVTAHYSTSDDYIETFTKEYLSFRSRSYERWLAWLAAHKAPGRLLDIGSGLGYFAHAASERGWDTTALEVSPSEAEYSRDILKVKTINGSLESSELEGMFDVVTMWDVLEHLNQPQDAIVRLVPYLKDNGFLFLKVPDGAAFQYQPSGYAAKLLYRLYLRRVYPLNPQEHYSHFTDEGIGILLERQAGLEIIHRDKTQAMDEIPVLSDSYWKLLIKQWLLRKALGNAWPHSMVVIASRKIEV